jgi:hypothetical protein
MVKIKLYNRDNKWEIIRILTHNNHEIFTNINMMCIVSMLEILNNYFFQKSLRLLCTCETVFTVFKPLNI